MRIDPVLLIGGSGKVGRWTAQLLRETNPGVPLLIGGRDRTKAEEFAASIGNAEGVAIDLTTPDLGLSDRPVSAVAIFVKDDALSGLRFAQKRGVPHVSISSLVAEIGPEVAAYMHQPSVAPVVLGAEWLVGATTIPTLHFAKDFAQLDDITIGELLDEQDAGGPAADADMVRLTGVLSAALTRRDGDFYWRVGEEAKATFHAVDGTVMDAVALAPYDILTLAAATDAPNIQLNLAVGVSSTRRKGEPMSTEIIIELTGKDHRGKPLHTRHAVVHPQGQMPLTGLGVAMVLERLLGLDNKPASTPSLYFPYQLLEPEAYFARLEKIGGIILDLPPTELG